MAWPLSKWKDMASTVQSLAVAVAVLIGGVWTLYVYDSLRQRDIAQLQRDKAILDKTKTEQELQPDAIIETTIALSQVSWFESRKLVEAKISFTNQGNRLESIKLRSPAIKIYKLVSGSKDEVHLESDTVFQLTTPRGYEEHYLSPKETTHVPPILLGFQGSGVRLIDVCIDIQNIGELETKNINPSITSLVTCEGQYFEVK